VSVFVVEVVAIVGGNDGNAGFLGEAEQFPVDALLDFQALVLNFEKEVAFAKDVAETIGVFAGAIEFFVDNGFGDGTAEAGAEGDEASGMLAEEIVVDARFVVKAFEVTGGDEFDEVAVALEGFAEEDKVVGAAGPGLKVVAVVHGGAGFFTAVEAAAFGEVDFAADDGLDVALAGFIEKIGGGEEVAVVGDGYGGHFLAGGLVEKLGGFAGTVEEAEVGVNVEVNELRIAHGVSL